MDSYTIVKSVLVGDSNAGKSSLMLHYTTGKKTPTSSTVGVEYGQRIIKRDRTYKLQIWDTAGQECFRSLTRNYYRGSSIIFIVFDLSSPRSFLSLEEWYRTASDEAAEENVIVFVGSKSDLPRRAPADVKSIISEFCKRNYMYFEVCHDDLENISQMFEKSLDSFVKQYPPHDFTIYIDPRNAAPSASRCSC